LVPQSQLYLEAVSGLADYQHNPDPEDPVSKLRMAMEDLDGQYRHFLGYLHLDLTSSSRCDPQFVIPEEKEDYTAPRDPDAMVIDPELSGEPSTATTEYEEHNADFPSSAVQQDQHPSAIQVG
jgi:hypothetical protein